MSEIIQFFTENSTFYLATVDQAGCPKIRPFGFMMEFEGKTYMVTGNNKDVYRQLKAQPIFEACSCSPQGDCWLRLRGKAVFENNPAAKAEAFQRMPAFNQFYRSPDNPAFEVFSIAQGEGTFYCLTAPPRTVKL